ncbi:hypothetical protein [Pseudoduganella lutea]|uniref:Uncharacterized protein n=1 Tax=Pseudoduganella lutea TaxID=321985 RepID=A0A4P6KV65_9BURK|nr:hypothetical protein [Pseudoduganella lutea]QBE62736.1 hypothetical protein EWM63_06925 [Pseudoduganella lutea]
MRSRYFIVAVIFGLSVLSLSMLRQSPVSSVPAVLSFRIGQTFEEVVSASTYPVVERSNVPTHTYLQAGETFVTESAVVLVFNDPKYGFRLPPTKFALVGYTHNRVDTVATTPLLEKVSFDRAVAVVENLQNQFKSSGWEPWREDGSTWFDLTIEGKKQLYARMFQPGFSQEATLRVPNKYGMTFRLWCAKGCSTGQHPYLFMIDIGISDDIEGRIQSRAKRQ